MARFGAYVKEVVGDSVRYRDLDTGRYFSSEEGRSLDSAARSYQHLAREDDAFRQATARGYAEANGLSLEDAKAETDAWLRDYAEAKAAGDDEPAFPGESP